MNIKKWAAGLAIAALVGTGSVVTTATAASAHTPGDSANCFTLNVSHKQYSESKTNPTPNKITVRIDGNDVDTAKFGTQFVKSYTFASSWVAHTWQVIVKTPDGYDYNSGVKKTSPCIPDKPVGYETPDSSFTVDCDANLVTIKNWKIVTSFTFNNATGKWDAVNTRVDLADTTRALTADEIKSCAGDEPQTKIDYGQWVDEKSTCELDVVLRHREVHTTTFTLVGTKWVGTTVITTEDSTRPKTPQEIKDCVEVPVITPRVIVNEVKTCENLRVTINTTTYTDTLAYDEATASYIVTTDTVGVLVVTDRAKTQDELEECYTVVAPVDPKVTAAKTCNTFGTVTPVPVEGVVYSTPTIDANGNWAVTATPAAGFKFAGDVQAIGFTGTLVKSAACIIKETTGLVTTGIEAAWIFWLSMSLLAGGTALLILRARKGAAA